MDDTPLVHRLAIEKLEAKAAELRSQWKWTRAVLDVDYASLAEFTHLRPQPAEAPAELAEEIERIEQRLGEFEETDEEEWTDELQTEIAQLEERRAEIDSIVDGLAVYSDKVRARAGCIVTIGDNGAFCLHQGLVERRNAKAAASSGETDDDIAGSIDADDDEAGQPPRASASAEQLLRKECGFSQLLVDDLKAHRHQITRAYLPGNFEVAFDLALYALCTDLFDRFRAHSNPLELRATEAHPRSSLNDLSGTPADRLIEAHGAALELDWLKLPSAQGFAALAALPADAKQRLFAWCIASTLKPQLAIEHRADPVLEAAGWRLAISLIDFWRPTAANTGDGQRRRTASMSAAKSSASVGRASMPI
jgi:ParB family chromosome partitioning protein